MRLLTLLLVVAAPAPPGQTATGPDFHVYVARLDEVSAVIAWGTTAEGQGNTIGHASVSHGKAEVRIAGRSLPEEERNWVYVRDLSPDREYPYEVRLAGRRIGQGAVRTYPRRADKLAFFVIGDWGTGEPPQHALAQAMAALLEERRHTDNPVRFVITTGDNIYADFVVFVRSQSGNEDSHWESKFFIPYEALLRHVPFYPSPGNHDGDESESSGDLAVYQDNFFIPDPGHFYSFRFAGLAEFFSLDSTRNARLRGERLYAAGGPQHVWLADSLSRAREDAVRWRIPYFHHPPFTAGPLHRPARRALAHYLALFERQGVKVVFSGHEHNFQVSEASEATGGIRYVVSGGGGSLRTGDVRSRMEEQHITGWAAAHHFLLVVIEGDTMRILPHVADSEGAPRPMEFRDRNGRLHDRLVIRLDGS